MNIHCHDIIIGKPVHKEMMDSAGYVNYPVEFVESISFTRYNKSNVFDVERGVSTQSIFGDLISFGVDINTSSYTHELLMAEMGLLDQPSVTRLNSDAYDASYIISPGSVCRITIWWTNNYKKTVSFLNTIHIKEAS